jgi:hypothetical protein
VPPIPPPRPATSPVGWPGSRVILPGPLSVPPIPPPRPATSPVGWPGSRVILPGPSPVPPTQQRLAAPP